MYCLFIDKRQPESANIDVARFLAALAHSFAVLERACFGLSPTASNAVISNCYRLSGSGFGRGGETRCVISDRERRGFLFVCSLSFAKVKQGAERPSSYCECMPSAVLVRETDRGVSDAMVR